jgi:hypothetical protein
MDFLAVHSRLAVDLAECGEYTMESLIPDGYVGDFVQHIAILETLHSQKHSVFGIITGRGTFACLRGRSETELDILAMLVNFLMLPDALAKKLQQEKTIAACHSFLDFHECFVENSDIASLVSIDAKDEPFNPSCPTLGIRQMLFWILHGDVDGMQWVFDKTGVIPDSAYINAASIGSVACLQWLYDHNAPAPTESSGYNAVIVAAIHGHLECLQWLHEHKFPFDEDAIAEEAIIGGFVDCLEYIHKHGGYIDDTACTSAARSGKVNCLRYLHENGFPWNSERPNQLYPSCEAAAANFPDCLEYLRKNGYPST